MNKEHDFYEICRNFNLRGELKDVVRYGEGHINDTYLLTFANREAPVRYILQRINNKLFTEIDKLMHNIELVTDFTYKNVVRRGGNPYRECLMLIKTKENKSFYYNGTDYFRIYVFIEGATAHQSVRSSRDFYESAVAFGNFAKLLADFDASQLYEVIPNFHNTVARYKNFEAAMQSNKFNRLSAVRAEADGFAAYKHLCGEIVDQISAGQIPIRVTHNDTKLNNIMIDDKTGEGIAVIDLDTVMPGSLCYDFGDSIRFGCSTAAEDERDLSKVNFRFDLYQTYLEGYMSAVHSFITKQERESLAISAILMTYECGIRFLTDYLEGDVYFRTTRPQQNLDRARTQLKLVRDMLKMFDRMQQEAAKY